MQNTAREIGFDTVIATATGLALVTYMLRLVLDPLLAVALGSVFIVGGTLVFIPKHARALAGMSGLVTLIVAGALIPRFVMGFTTVKNPMATTLGLGVIVLLFTFVIVHITAFRPRVRQPVD
ncbi:hypothetical protein [Haladaptatus salinisoli]|uniref:hypothetical protein n=1 Tax=Haladaptatus salinisoli TaxID=2884876 RepID=UPI001D0AB3AD|nr:hypothetical protein [Haladaptatus salinisoli]